MSGEVQAAPEPIQLHFCQRCGISIPVADVESGRARPAPGGYVCVGCVYEHRDHETAAPAAPREAAAREGGSRVLLALALLYVVGATSFLLVRELQREPPAVQLPESVSPESFRALDDKVSQFERAWRDRVEAERLALNALAEDILALRRRGEETQVSSLDIAQKLFDRADDLRGSVLTLADRTLGLKHSVDELMVRQVRAEAEASKNPEPPDAPASPPASPPPAQPAKSREELERERLAGEYIQQLKGKDSPNQTRYNAAVALGDLEVPAAVEPLIAALDKDPYDLVRRAAAWALGRLGKQAVGAIPALIQQIGGKEEYVAYMCERALMDITKAVTGAAVSFKCDPAMSLKQRRQIQKQWEEWWEKNRSAVAGDGA
ncbi:MAG: HEAT repeat domain-containing protein [Planctomycetota bacterium]